MTFFVFKMGFFAHFYDFTFSHHISLHKCSMIYLFICFLYILFGNYLFFVKYYGIFHVSMMHHTLDLCDFLFFLYLHEFYYAKITNMVFKYWIIIFLYIINSACLLIWITPNLIFKHLCILYISVIFLYVCDIPISLNSYHIFFDISFLSGPNTLPSPSYYISFYPNILFHFTSLLLPPPPSFFHKSCFSWYFFSVHLLKLTLSFCLQH